MNIERIAYSNERIGLLKQLLLNIAKTGKPAEYEILVDNLKVIPRTNNHEMFDDFEDFVNNDTKTLTILIFEGTSKRNNRYIFTLKDEKTSSEPPALSGIEVEKMVSEKLEAERRQWKYDQLQKENEELRGKLEEAEECIELFDKKLEEVRNAKGKLTEQWGELATFALEGVIKNNAHKMQNIPFLGGLSGVIAKEDAPGNEQRNEDTSCSFKRKGNGDNDLSPEDKALLETVKRLNNEFSEDEIEQIRTILGVFLEDHGAIEPVLEFLEENDESEPETQEPAEDNKAA